MSNSTNDKKYKLSMKSDFVFKGVFAKPGNEDMLIDFLKSILNLDIKKIEVERDVALSKEAIENKYGVLDLRATLNDDTYVIIEMQVKKQPDMPVRLSFYSGKTFAYQAKESDSYDSLKRVYTVCICDYIFTPFEEYLSECVTVIKKHREFEIDNGIYNIYLELPKFRKQKDLDYTNPLVQWLLFIDGENKKGVEMAMKNNEKIKKAFETKEYLTSDEEFRVIADLRQKSQMDYNSGIKHATEKGVEKGIDIGIEKGIEEEKIKIAKEMLENGFDVSTISKITKLSEEEINTLKN